MKSAALKFAKLILIFAISYSPVISQTQTSQNQDSSSSDEVVKISTNLVQIDAVVTDKDGNHVRDLSAEDFEVYEDGKKQEITNFSYIQTAATSTNALTEKKVVNKTAINNLPPISPTRIRSENVKRTIALVVDDLGLSFESMVFVRNALIKFVNEQMQPNDLIAIVRTSAGTGALQQFTTDKRLLLAAIDRIQFSFKGNIELGNFSPLKQAGLGRPNGNPSNVSSAPTNDGLEEFRRDSFVIGTLGAVSYVIRGLRDMPGRKSVIFLSDGISIYSGLIQGSRAAYNNSFLGNGYQDKVIDAMLRLTDQANRASVVISTVDARGLITLKEFSPSQKSSNEDITLDAVQRLREDIFSSQAGLGFLASQTGGIFRHSTNDLAGAIKAVVDDQSGYYLIGYTPDDETFSTKGRNKFHQIKVKIKRKELVMRARSGFYGITDDELKPALVKRGVDKLLAAMESPFAAADVPVRLTSLFGFSPQTGSVMRSLLHIDAHSLSFAKQPDGSYLTNLEIAAKTYDTAGRIVDQVGQTQTLRVKAENYDTVMRDGLSYTINVPIKKAGAYQLRLVVRDEASDKLGSANQFIQVPDLKNNQVAISGLLINGVIPPNNNQQAPSGQLPAQNSTIQSGPSLRRIRRGMSLEYVYAIYNARINDKTRLPQLTTQVRLFRDDKEIYASPASPYSVGQQTDLKNLLAISSIQLGNNLEPGNYYLQVIVTDLLAKEKERISIQWSDFEIVK